MQKGSFRAAAKALGRSQPTISVSFKNLEDEVEFPILNRDEYRPKLTERGKFFYEESLVALKEFRKLSALGIEMGKKKVETLLRISLDPLTHTKSIAGVIESAHKRTDRTQLIFSESILSGGVTEILNGQADLALPPRSETAQEIDCIPFCSVTLIPVVSKNLFNPKKGSDLTGKYDLHS